MKRSHRFVDCARVAVSKGHWNKPSRRYTWRRELIWGREHEDVLADGQHPAP